LTPGHLTECAPNVLPGRVKLAVSPDIALWRARAARSLLSPKLLGG
jgi:hypothetical protein